jgi:hypothetical protein
MLAKSPSLTDDEIEAALGTMVGELLPATPDGPPRLPPIEEFEHQPRRRKQSNLRYLDQRFEEDGTVWLETIAIARPGYKIIGVRRRTCAGHAPRWIVLTKPIRRRRKTNGARSHDNV